MGDTIAQRAFLFTDIEGSTRLWEQFPLSMATAIERHNQLIAQAVRRHGGSVFKTMGDSVCAVFPDARGALLAAVDAQISLVRFDWETVGVGAPLRVRMAVHAGEAREQRGDYAGPVLNRIARILAAGHGGQILIAGSAAALLEGGAPDGLELRSLGDRRLRDVPGTEHILQIVRDGLAQTFPPLNTLDLAAHNLPVAPTVCLGRDGDRQRIRNFLTRTDNKLITLIGPGGIGKTRLAIQVGNDLLDNFANGIWFVDLSGVRDDDLIAGAVMRVLDVREEPGIEVEKALGNWLGARNLLLILDNCEQVIDGAAGLAAMILRTAPGVRVLATSRIALEIRGEQRLPVNPLSLPSINDEPDLGIMAENPSVSLFVDRAVAVQPDFSLDTANVPHVAEICRRVDGIPLALELAAARITILSPAELQERLERRLPALTGGPRDLPARHKTLHDAIAWSYDLLDAEEQAHFCRLSVFVGGWTIGAANAVLKMDSEFILESLAAKSLIRAATHAESDVRYSMLETIREFASERFETVGERFSVQERHTQWFLQFAEDELPRLYGQNLATDLARFDRENPNLRSAFESTLESSPLDACRLCNVMARFWNIHGLHREGCEWFTSALSLVVDEIDPIVARSHQAFAGLLIAVGQFDNADSHFRTALSIRLAIGDRRQIGIARLGVGYFSILRGNLDEGQNQLDEALLLLTEFGDHPGLGVCRMNRRELELRRRRFDEAEAEARHALEHFKQAGDHYGTSNATSRIAQVLQWKGELDNAERSLHEVVERYQDSNDEPGLAFVAHERSMIAFQHGELATAARYLLDALTISKSIANLQLQIECLQSAAVVLAAADAFGPALNVLGSLSVLRLEMGIKSTPFDEWHWNRVIDSVDRPFDANSVDSSLEEGKRLLIAECTDLVELHLSRITALVSVDADTSGSITERSNPQ